VELFVREKVRGLHPRGRPVVLMIAGATVSAVPDFDLQFGNYSWMEYLAAAGFDVFTMDFTGYGLSPRPMMDDPCNNSPSDQQAYLVPKPVGQPCSPSYPFQLTTIQSDWDEIDTVVNYLRRFRNINRVNLVAWSRGGARAGGYAALHPERVEKLFLLAPGRYYPLSPSDPPAALPLPGVPVTVLASGQFHNAWDADVKCENQFPPQIRDVITSTMLDFDPLGSTWGTAGVRRAPVWNSPPGFLNWGWNTGLANQVKAPTLIIRGDLDNLVPLGDLQSLYRDLGGVQQKVFVHVACASHYLPWENQHMVLLQASEEWLLHGTFAGQESGSFAVDIIGGVHKEQ
jgi:pimeloyl-ACP methyl ester carboxylesterase